MKSESKRVVAITGGSRGIGEAIAQLFNSRDHYVVICSRAERGPALSPDIKHSKVDVRNRDEMKRFIANIATDMGSLDVFVNCAGISRWRAVEDIDESFIKEMVETNLLGTLWGCALASQMMKDGGCIVNVSSLASKRGSANNSAYCATKFAVNGITQSLAKELGQQGIRVNAVCPVYVETDHILSALAESASPVRGESVERYLDSFVKDQTALGRLPTAMEVAETVYFLASPAASAITGQCLNVDCGVLPQ